MLKLVLSQIVGQPTTSVWSQALVVPTVPIAKPILIDSSSQVMCLVTLSHISSGDKVAIESGRIVLQELTRLIDQPSLSMGQIIPLIKSYLDNVLKHQIETSNEITICLFDHKRLDCIGIGLGKVVLMRNSQIGLIYVGKKDSVTHISGEFLPNDKLLTGTNGLVGEMSQPLTQELLKLSDPNQAREELAVMIQAQGESEALAGFIVYCHDSSGDLSLMTHAIKDNSLISEPDIYLTKSKPKKVAFSVGIVLLILILVSVGFGWRQRQQIVWNQSYGELVEQVELLLSEAERLQPVNPAGARQATDEVRRRLDEGKGIFAPKPDLASELSLFSSHVDQRISEILGLKPVEEILPWYELGLIRKDSFGSAMTLAGQRLYVLDSSNNLILRIDTITKSGEVALGGEIINNPRSMAISGNRALILSDGGVLEASLTNKTTAMLIPSDSTWVNPSLIGLFGNNIYVLDPRSDDLWRYPSIDGGLGSKQRWFGPGVEPSLNRVIDIAIDGDIWFLENSGNLMRFSRGVKEEFGVTGLDGDMTEATSIWTSELSDTLYVLDRTNTRVVLLSKEGVYKQQYVWTGLAVAQDIVVDEDLQTIYVLAGDTIYAIDL